MSWLFWVLLVILMIFVIQGFRKGLVRTAVSMVFFLIVIAVTMWLNPHISGYIREKTDWQEKIEERCGEFLVERTTTQTSASAENQESFIGELPLPQTMKEKLIENNNVQSYQQMAVEGFVDYLSQYIAYAVINGIAFLVSFILTIIVVKMILYAVDILMELPVLGTINRIGGGALGALQGLVWIWIGFSAVALLYNTQVGGYFLGVIREDMILCQLYDKNYLLWFLMELFV